MCPFFGLGLIDSATCSEAAIPGLKFGLPQGMVECIEKVRLMLRVALGKVGAYLPGFGAECGRGVVESRIADTLELEPDFHRPSYADEPVPRQLQFAGDGAPRRGDNIRSNERIAARVERHV